MSDTPYVEAWLEGPKSTSFFTRTYEVPASLPRKAHLIFIHGFAEHIARYEHVFPFYASKGISTFAYDQRGFGRTALDESKRSKGSSYGVTSWKDQKDDITFWIQSERKRVGAEVPIFLVGHSMGGGEVLNYATNPPPPKDGLSELSGIIGCSPLIRQASPAPKWQVWLGSKAASILPNKLIPAPVIAEDLSHDPVVNEAYVKDPLVKPMGTLRGVGDMLSIGIDLAEKNYKNWPPTLPLLLIHGGSDRVTSHETSQKLHDEVIADDKSISIYEGAYHEISNEPDFRERFMEEVSAWIIARSTPKSTGAEESTSAPASKL